MWSLTQQQQRRILGGKHLMETHCLPHCLWVWCVMTLFRLQGECDIHSLWWEGPRAIGRWLWMRCNSWKLEGKPEHTARCEQAIWPSHDGHALNWGHQLLITFRLVSKLKSSWEGRMLDQAWSFPEEEAGLSTVLSSLATSSYMLCVCMFSHVWLFVTLWTVAHQSPLSMEFSRQEY